ncbi:MAG: hypothetical protein AB7S38_37450 [Vulcanimicrobiota bacterium]
MGLHVARLARTLAVVGLVAMVYAGLGALGALWLGFDPRQGGLAGALFFLVSLPLGNLYFWLFAGRLAPEGHPLALGPGPLTVSGRLSASAHLERRGGLYGLVRTGLILWPFGCHRLAQTIGQLLSNRPFGPADLLVLFLQGVARFGLEPVRWLDRPDDFGDLDELVRAVGPVTPFDAWLGPLFPARVERWKALARLRGWNGNQPFAAFVQADPELSAQLAREPAAGLDLATLVGGALGCLFWLGPEPFLVGPLLGACLARLGGLCYRLWPGRAKQGLAALALWHSWLGWCSISLTGRAQGLALNTENGRITLDQELEGEVEVSGWYDPETARLVVSRWSTQDRKWRGLVGLRLVMPTLASTAFFALWGALQWLKI